MKLNTLEIKTFYFSIYFHLSYPVLLVWIWRITKNWSNFYKLWTNLRLVLVLTVPQFTTSIHKLPPPPLFFDEKSRKVWKVLSQSDGEIFDIVLLFMLLQHSLYTLSLTLVHAISFVNTSPTKLPTFTS